MLRFLVRIELSILTSHSIQIWVVTVKLVADRPMSTPAANPQGMIRVINNHGDGALVGLYFDRQVLRSKKLRPVCTIIWIPV